MVLVRDLIIHNQIKTTVAKAKAIQPMVDKLITTAKKGTPAAYKNVLKVIDNGKLAAKLMADAKDRFSGRTSGYTRMIKLGMRLGDSSKEVLLAFVDEPIVQGEVVHEKKKEEIQKEKPKETEKPKIRKKAKK